MRNAPTATPEINEIRNMTGTASPYDVLIMDHIKHARNYTVLDDVNRRAVGINPLCGDELTVYLRIAHERVERITFQCACCGISMASASIMTEMVKGQDTGDARMLLRAFIAILFDQTESRRNSLAREQLAILETVQRFPSRMRCAALRWETLEGGVG
jgi:nitrogen fixation NifU-like protein